MATELIKDALHRAETGQELTLAGWVRTIRNSKAGLSFITLNDGSCLASIQIVAEKDLPNYESEILHLTAGCSLEISGELVESPAKGQRV